MYISLGSKFHNRVNGLCGNYNGKEGDELKSVVKANNQEFGAYWATSGNCPQLGPDDVSTEPCKVGIHSFWFICVCILSQ